MSLPEKRNQYVRPDVHVRRDRLGPDLGSVCLGIMTYTSHEHSFPVRRLLEHMDPPVVQSSINVQLLLDLIHLSTGELVVWIR